MKNWFWALFLVFMASHCIGQDLDFNVKKKKESEPDTIPSYFLAVSSFDTTTGSSWGRTYEWYDINKSRPDTTAIVIAFKPLPLQDTIHLSMMPIISGDVLGINRPKLASPIYSWDITIKGPDKNTSTTLNESRISEADAISLAKIRSTRKGRAVISNLICYNGTTRIKLNKTLLILP